MLPVKVDLIAEIEREIAALSDRARSFEMLVQAYTRHRDETDDPVMRDEMARRVRIVTAAAEDELGRWLVRANAAFRALQASIDAAH